MVVDVRRLGEVGRAKWPLAWAPALNGACRGAGKEAGALMLARSAGPLRS